MVCLFSETSWSSRVDGEGAFLIDRCPVYFEALLNYLRQGALILNDKVDVKGLTFLCLLLLSYCLLHRKMAT